MYYFFFTFVISTQLRKLHIITTGKSKYTYAERDRLLKHNNIKNSIIAKMVVNIIEKNNSLCFCKKHINVEHDIADNPEASKTKR